MIRRSKKKLVFPSQKDLFLKIFPRIQLQVKKYTQELQSNIHIEKSKKLKKKLAKIYLKMRDIPKAIFYLQRIQNKGCEEYFQLIHLYLDLGLPYHADYCIVELRNNFPTIAIDPKSKEIVRRMESAQSLDLVSKERKYYRNIYRYFIYLRLAFIDRKEKVFLKYYKSALLKYPRAHVYFKCLWGIFLHRQKKFKKFENLLKDKQLRYFLKTPQLSKQNCSRSSILISISFI